MARKLELRAQIKLTLARYSKKQLEDKNASVNAKLLALLEKLDFQSILSYQPHFHGEISLVLPPKRFSLFLPRTGESEMSFHQLSNEEQNSQLESGRFGISEPKIDCLKFSEKLHSPAVILVPGLAFDVQGNRLGRGKGYYDRFLSDNASLVKIGICYDFQLISDVPTEPHDIKMDYVIDSR